ncbi:MAG: hypothetical protein MR807_04945 [Erysipelotrichaceae bacterium]|nr:hypothetical protein [Erysipelotrichaceae bacterium]
MILNKSESKLILKHQSKNKDEVLAYINKVLQENQTWKNKDVRYLVLLDFRNKIMSLTEQDFDKLWEEK